MTISAEAGRSAGRGARCRFDLSVKIGCPPADVFALLADVQDAEPIPRRPSCG